MNIIALVKQVPNTTQVRLDPKTGNLVREGLESIMNPDDRHAVEAAVTLKESYGGSVTAVSMGPPQAVDVLTQAMGMGADRGILLSDPAFAGADTWATSLTLSRAIQAVGSFDLILCGHQAIDGDTAQIGPQVADWLDIAQATCVMEIEAVESEEIIVKRRLDNGFQRIACRMPALLTVVRELNIPRFPHMGHLISACTDKAPIKVWNAADIGVQIRDVGLAGSFTHVIRTFTPNFSRQKEILEGNVPEAVTQLIARLKKSDTTIAHRL